MDRSLVKIWRSFFDHWYWLLISTNHWFEVSIWYFRVFFVTRFYHYNICRALLRRRLECSCLTGLGLMEWGCPAKCDQKRKSVVQGCEGRSTAMSLDGDSWEGVQPHHATFHGDQWWDKLLGVTWLLHQCPFWLLCVCCSSGKQHRPTPSAACEPSCVSCRSTQSMDPPLAFQDPAKTRWVLKQRSYDSSLACFVICQSLCLTFAPFSWPLETN